MLQDRVDSRAGSPTGRGGGAPEAALSTPLKQVQWRMVILSKTGLIRYNNRVIIHIITWINTGQNS